MSGSSGIPDWKHSSPVNDPVPDCLPFPGSFLPLLLSPLPISGLPGPQHPQTSASLDLSILGHQHPLISASLDLSILKPQHPQGGISPPSPERDAGDAGAAGATGGIGGTGGAAHREGS